MAHGVHTLKELTESLWQSQRQQTRQIQHPEKIRWLSGTVQLQPTQQLEPLYCSYLSRCMIHA